MRSSRSSSLASGPTLPKGDSEAQESWAVHQGDKPQRSAGAERLLARAGPSSAYSRLALTTLPTCHRSSRCGPVNTVPAVITLLHR